MIVDKYVLTEEIGNGAFSTVFRAHDINDPARLYAIKSIKNIPGIDSKVQSEIELLEKIKHRNIVEFIESIHQKDKEKWYIVLEYCGKGDLENYLKKQGRQSERFCKNLAYAIISALEQLHSQAIAHRDLKLSNILINEEYEFKIADFGMARIETDGLLESFCGTPYAMAPEILRREKYDTRCDTWALGIMIYQLAFGRLPFNVTSGGFIALTKVILETEPCYKFPEVSVSESCIDFIKLCLKKRSQERPTMKSLINHTWLQSEIGSTIRVAMFKDSLEKDKLESLKEENKKKIREVFSMVVRESMEKLVKKYKLQDKEIAELLGAFDKYYAQEKETRMNIILMIGIIIKELSEKKIVIEIEDIKFEVSLNKIKSFKNHIDNLKNFLSSQATESINKIDQSLMNVQHNLIYFATNQAQFCINLTENILEKVKVIRYISQLPIKESLSPQITVKWSFTNEDVDSQKVFNEMLSNVSNEEVVDFVNSGAAFEDKEKNWIIEHDFPEVRREGNEIEVGEFISKIIEIHYSQKE